MAQVNCKHKTCLDSMSYEAKKKKNVRTFDCMGNGLRARFDVPTESMMMIRTVRYHLLNSKLFQTKIPATD